MPKVGRYDYPFFDIDSCIEKLGRFHDVAKTDAATRTLVAETLGMAITGGGFASLMASMEKYGLIQTGGGNVTITKLGKLTLYGEPSEMEQAKKQAVANVDLFRDIFEQYGKDVQIEQIRAFLRQKANVDITIAQKMAPNVANIYKKVSNYIVLAKKLEEASTKHTISSPSIGGSDRIMERKEGEAPPLKIQYGDVFIQIPPNDLKAIALAKDALEFMEKKLLEQTKKEKQ